MVRIRLRRTGSRNQPSFRIVAAEKEKPRDGRFLEILGHYNPRTEPATIQVDEARIFHWLGNGAQPSESVRKILQVAGTWDRWTRYQSGEELEKLLEEAEAAVVEVDPRTRRDDLVPKGKSKKAKKQARAEAASEQEEAVKEEPEAEPEASAEEAPEAQESDQDGGAENEAGAEEVAEEEQESPAEPEPVEAEEAEEDEESQEEESSKDKEGE
jgi:small subunit ribosomal protein S16